MRLLPFWAGMAAFASNFMCVGGAGLSSLGPIGGLKSGFPAPSKSKSSRVDSPRPLPWCGLHTVEEVWHLLRPVAGESVHRTPHCLAGDQIWGWRHFIGSRTWMKTVTKLPLLGQRLSSSSLSSAKSPTSGGGWWIPPRSLPRCSPCGSKRSRDCSRGVSGESSSGMGSSPVEMTPCHY
jgi:hypothetical protein